MTTKCLFQTRLSGRDDLQILNDPTGTHSALLAILGSAPANLKCESCRHELNWTEGDEDSIFGHFTHADPAHDGYCRHDIDKQATNRSWMAYNASNTAAAETTQGTDEVEIKLLKDATEDDLLQVNGIGSSIAKKIVEAMKSASPPTSWKNLREKIQRFGDQRAKSLETAGYRFGAT